MPAKKPIVVTDGQLEQLQAGDYLTSPDLFNRQNETGGALVRGTPVYVPAAGEIAKAQANAQATMKVFGLVADASIADASAGAVQTDGNLVASTAEWDAITGETGGLTPNAVYFLSAAAAGMLTQTAPTTDGQFVVRVGTALSTTELEISFGQPIKL